MSNWEVEVEKTGWFEWVARVYRNDNCEVIIYGLSTKWGALRRGRREAYRLANPKIIRVKP